MTDFERKKDWDGKVSTLKKKGRLLFFGGSFRVCEDQKPLQTTLNDLNQ